MFKSLAGASVSIGLRRRFSNRDMNTKSRCFEMMLLLITCVRGDDVMARMTCRCGAYLSNHEAPNDIQLRVYTDREWEQICDCESVQPWMIPCPRYDVWRCPVCKRIYVFENNVPIMIYCLET